MAGAFPGLCRIVRGLILIGSILTWSIDRLSAVPETSLPLSASAEALVARARSTLDEALKTEQGWIRIHAAEALIALGGHERMRRLFEAELPAWENSPYRIGAWRVLAATASAPEDKAAWIARIEKVFLDPTSPDRLQAIESLCKLRHVLGGAALAAAREMEGRVAPADALFPLWALCLAGEDHALERLAGSLASPEAAVRRRAALVLRWLAPPERWIRRELARAADVEPASTVASPYLVSAALWLDVDAGRRAAWRARLEQHLMTGPAGVRLEACQTLMRIYAPRDLSRVVALLEHPEGDVRLGAAWMILAVMARPARDEP